MKLRLLTALVLIPPLALLIGWSPQSASAQQLHELLYLAVVIAIVERSYYEYLRLSRQAGWEAMGAAGYASAALLCVGQYIEVQCTAVPGVFILSAAVLVLLAVPAAGLRGARGFSPFFCPPAPAAFGGFFFWFFFFFLSPRPL